LNTLAKPFFAIFTGKIAKRQMCQNEILDADIFFCSPAEKKKLLFEAAYSSIAIIFN